MQSKEKIIIHGGIQDTITISHLILFSSLSDSGLAPLQRCDVKVLHDHHRYVGGISFWWGEGQKICQVITEI